MLRNVDVQLLKSGKSEVIQRSDFVNLIGHAFKELNERLLDITNKCNVMTT